MIKYSIREHNAPGKSILTAEWNTKYKSCINSWIVDSDGDYEPRWVDADRKTPSNTWLTKATIVARASNKI